MEDRVKKRPKIRARNAVGKFFDRKKVRKRPCSLRIDKSVLLVVQNGPKQTVPRFLYPYSRLSDTKHTRFACFKFDCGTAPSVQAVGKIKDFCPYAPLGKPFVLLFQLF